MKQEAARRDARDEDIVTPYRAKNISQKGIHCDSYTEEQYYMKRDYDRQGRQQSEIMENPDKNAYCFQRRLEVQNKQAVAVDILQKQLAIIVDKCKNNRKVIGF